METPDLFAMARSPILDFNMDEQPQINAEAASAEAIHSAKNAAQALETARQAQLADAVERTAIRTKESLLEGLREVFGDDSKDPAQMKVLVQRVPLLCQNVEQTHKDIADIKDSLAELKDIVDRKYVTIEAFSPVKIISYGTVTFLTSICLAAAVSKLIS